MQHPVRLLSRVAGLLLILGGLAPLHAQRVAADIAVGGSTGTGHSGLTLDIGLTGRVPTTFGHWFAGVAGALEGDGNQGDECRLRTPPGPCLNSLTFHSLTALAGADHSFGFLAAELAGGAGYYASSDQRSAGGFQLRAALAAPAGRAAAFLVTGRRTWLPSYEGHLYQINAVTVGLRLRL